MTKIKFLSVLICVGLVSGSAFAGTDAAAFLKKGVGARALAMGGAFTSIADDTSAVYWNPAGLAKRQQYAFTAMGASGASDKYPGLKDIVPTHQFFALAVPATKFTKVLGKTVFGLGYISSTMDNIQYNPEGSKSRKTMSHTDNAYYLSAGIPVFQGASNLYAGASLKIISYKFSEAGISDSGIDLDAGLIYSISSLNFGAFIQKGVVIGDDEAPLTAKFGISNLFDLGKNFQLLPALDLIQRQEDPLSSNLGLEFGMKNVLMKDNFGINGLFLRGGIEGYAIENRHDISSELNKNIGYNFGFGVDFYISKIYLQLDIALLSGNIFEQNTKFSLNLYF